MKLNQNQKNSLKNEIEFQFSRSSGPGGQKVNKTESQAELRWKVAESQVLRSEQIEKVQEKLNNLINKEGELIISSDQFRSRERNKEACLERLYDHLNKALEVPKKRKKTKPSKASIEKRLQQKKQLGEKKRNRQKW